MPRPDSEGPSRTILQVAEKTYRYDNDPAEEIINFFTRQSEKEDWLYPAHWEKGTLERMRERKQRTLASDRAPTGAQGASERPLVAPQRTNRGVTFHGDAKLPAQQTPHRKRLGGYDGGVEVGFYGEWNLDRFLFVQKKLQAAKERVASGETQDKFVTLCGLTFEIKAHGVTKGVHYDWVLEGSGMTILLKNITQCENVQLCRVRYGAESLIGTDLFSLHDDLLQWFENAGFNVTEEKLSRVDLQVMLFRDVLEFVTKIFNNQSVCTAVKNSVHGRGNRIQTYTLGTDLQLCIYDKRAELFDTMRKKPEKTALMVEHCFPDEWLVTEIPTTRIEFRLRRKFLKGIGLDTMQNLKERENDLVHYCTENWFRILSEPKKKGTLTSSPRIRFGKRCKKRFKNTSPALGKQGKICGSTRNPFLVTPMATRRRRSVFWPRY